MPDFDLENMTQAEFEASRVDIFRQIRANARETPQPQEPETPRFKVPSARSIVAPILSHAQLLERMSQSEFEQRRDEILGWARDGKLF